MKRIFWIVVMLCAVLMLCAAPVAVHAAAPTPLESFSYSVTGPGTVLLTRYNGTDTSVSIPGTYFLNGSTYQVQLASKTVFVKNETLRTVRISSGVAFQDSTMHLLFYKCTALSSVVLNMDTSYVTDMSYAFYDCQALETLDLSALDTKNVTTMQAMFSGCSSLKKLTGYESWNTQALRSIAYMFNETKQLGKVDLSRWTLGKLENSGWCFQKCGASQILLPEDLAVISAGFFNHVTAYAGSSFTVPAGVKKIGYAHTIYDFGTEEFKEFSVAAGNTAYKAVDGILYCADGTELLAVPRGKVFPKGVFAIPEGVTFLGELSFSRNEHIKTLVLPDSYILQYVPRNDPAYILFEDMGNLNAGLNLHIAIYCYTGIKSYAVKESNPNYRSVDGLLYTKDGTALVAVPTCYDSKLEIPEGVTRWESAAMWNAGDVVDALMKDCPGVTIPASLTQIAADQLEKLNRLESRYPGFQITVSQDNSAYYTGESGQLLEKSNLEDLQVTLLQTRFVYDGQPQMPQVLATQKGKKLKEGTDYTVTYFKNTNAGTGWVRITGMGDYYGTVEVPFTIEKAQPTYTLPQDLYGIYGKTLGQIKLPKGFSWMEPDTPVGDTGIKQFFLCYNNGDPNYVTLSDIPVSLLVIPRKIDGQSVGVALWHPWTGSAVKPAVYVADAAGTVPSREYTCTYQNNVTFGKGSVVLQDVPGGNYKVNAEVTFYIVPGPLLCTAALTLLWCLTTGICLKKQKKAAPSQKPSETR